MSWAVPSAEVDAQLMHHLKTTYAPLMRTQRFHPQPILLERPPSTMYASRVTLTCDTCEDSIDYQVLSLLAAWLRWGLWVVLTAAGLAATVWGTVLAIRTEASGRTGLNLLFLGIFTLSVFGLLWVTDFGVSGTGTRFTIDPHGLRRSTNAHHAVAVECDRCGHREPFDGHDYPAAKARMAQHGCR